MINNPSKATLSSLYSSPDARLEIPLYQRSYSWTRDQASELWHDLVAFHPPDQAGQYFLGAIVATEDKALLTIIDGQQRLATLTILLSAIRDVLKPIDDAGAQQLHGMALQHVALDPNQEPADRLILGAYDKDVFSQSIVRYDSASFAEPSKLPSHKMLREVRDLFVSKVEERVRDLPDDQARRTDLLQLAETITGRLVFVLVTTDAEGDASDVFETLNDRGVGLSTLDLLRNFLLGRAPNSKQREEISRWWEEVFEVSDRPADVQAFLRHFWVSRHGDVKQHSLYREMRAHLDAAFKEKTDTPRDFSIELSTSADIYRQLLRPASTSNKDLNEVLDDIAAAGGSALYPAVLTAVETNSAAATVPLAKALLSHYVRWSIIGRRESTVLEQHVLRVCEALRNRKEAPGEAAKLLNVPETSDAAFREAFKTASLTRPGQRRYIMEQLEIQARSKAKKAEAKADMPKLHVEHIYPQKPRTKSARLKTHDAMIHRIGNLTLIKGSWNSEMKNGDFATVKLPKFKESEIVLNRWIAQQAKWGESEIEQRQGSLSNDVAAIWPRA